MRIQVINVAQKLPAWVDTACDDYLKRIPREISLQFVTVPLASRKSQQSRARLQQQESAHKLEKLPSCSLNIALEEGVESWSTADWSKHMQIWMFYYPLVNMIICGPYVVTPAFIEVCRHRVSLGKRTMPHALVKVVLVEQLYRAWTILKGHPYHRQ